MPDYTNENGERKSLFGFRIHHVLGDGYSMLEFLERVLDENSTGVIPERSVTRRANLGLSLTEQLRMRFWIPLTIGNHFSDYMFHSDYFSTTKINPNISLTRITMELSVLKTIRRELSDDAQASVSFVTVILFVFGGALRKFLLGGDWNRKLSTVQVESLKSVNVAIGLPKSTPHPVGKFCNHW